MSFDNPSYVSSSKYCLIHTITYKTDTQIILTQFEFNSAQFWAKDLKILNSTRNQVGDFENFNLDRERYKFAPSQIISSENFKSVEKLLSHTKGLILNFSH